MTKFASADLTVGQINAIVKKLGGHEGALRFLRGETLIAEPEKKWREENGEENGVIYFSVTSDGTTGEEWIARLESKGFRVSDYVKSALCSEDFKPTSGVTTEIAILKGILFNDSDRITKNIRAKASEFGFSMPNAEVSCLIRENFSDKDLEDMGFYWISVMHKPIKNSDGDPLLLSVDRNAYGSWLGTNYDYPDYWWSRGYGFAFVASKVSGS